MSSTDGEVLVGTKVECCVSDKLMAVAGHPAGFMEWKPLANAVLLPQSRACHCVFCSLVSPAP